MNGLKGLIEATGGLISYSITLVVGLSLLVFFWGLAKYVFKSGNADNQEEGRNLMLWGVITLFVMMSVWGIVYFFQRSFGLVAPNNIVDPTEPLGPPNPLFPEDPNERNT
ncbi:MAG: pilin [bacterium]